MVWAAIRDNRTGKKYLKGLRKGGIEMGYMKRGKGGFTGFER